MLNVGWNKVFKIVTNLLNKCLYEGTISKDSKETITELFHKKGDKTGLENYRPISLLSYVNC